MIAAANAVLDDAEVGKAIWVGNSMGGWVAWRAGLDAPDRVNGLVLVDASGAVANPPVQPYLGARLAQSWIGRQLLPIITPRAIIRSSLEANYADPKLLGTRPLSREPASNRRPRHNQS
jgi:pimeloyl-ACP methyl ester carboxylesterase